MICPKCGHEFPAPQQSAAGQSRWSGVTREERAALARKGWRRRKKDMKRANTKLSGGGPLRNETTEAESRRPLE